ncbi:MAG: hypothetical protein U1E14_00875 [Geminicoccaceae bacterium]
MAAVLDLAWGWPVTLVLLVLAYVLAARGRVGLALLVWLPSLWQAVRLLDPVVGPTPPAGWVQAMLYLQSALLALGAPMLATIAVKRKARTGSGGAGA